MKKIVFVEKEEGSYDPVTAYFGKKPPSQAKTINTTTFTNNKATLDKKSVTGIPPVQKKNTAQPKGDEITPKTDKKINTTHAPPQAKAYPIKEQALKTRDLSRTNIKKQTKANITKKQTEKSIEKPQLQQQKVEQRQDSIQKMKVQINMKPLQKGESKGQSFKGDVLNKKIKQLQLRQQQYIRRIQDLQAKEQKYVKNQQKLTKMQKDLKTAVQKNKQTQKLFSDLKQKDQQIKQMLEGTAIPFSRKRQVILSNKLKQLKRMNRQLVLRLKNYKGTDLVQLSIQQNREEIMKDLYAIDVEKQLNQEINVQMQSLISQLAHKLNAYVEKRVKQKGQRLAWSEEQVLLVQAINLAQRISLNYLNKYQVCPLPQSNEEAHSAYSILEQYKKRQYMEKIMDRFSINLAISQQNNQIISQIQEGNDQLMNFKAEITKPKRKKEISDKSKFNQYVSILQIRSNFTQNLLIQSICQVQLIKEWIQKVHSKVIQQVNSISKITSEIKDIVALGASGKQSLYFYLQNNIASLETRFPSLKLKIKQIQNNFSDIQRLCVPK